MHSTHRSFLICYSLLRSSKNGNAWVALRRRKQNSFRFSTETKAPKESIETFPLQWLISFQKTIRRQRHIKTQYSETRTQIKLFRSKLTINSTWKFRLIARIHHNVFRYGLDSCTICLHVASMREETEKGTFIKIHHEVRAESFAPVYETYIRRQL